MALQTLDDELVRRRTQFPSQSCGPQQLDGPDAPLLPQARVRMLVGQEQDRRDALLRARRERTGVPLVPAGIAASSTRAGVAQSLPR